MNHKDIFRQRQCFPQDAREFKIPEKGAGSTIFIPAPFKDKLILGLSIIIFVLLSLAGFTIYHELVHGEIYRSYGSDVHYSFNGLSATTWGTCNDNPTCISEQNWTDIIGYHISGAYLMLFGLMFVWWILNSVNQR